MPVRLLTPSHARLVVAIVIALAPSAAWPQEQGARPEVGHALEAAETAIRDKQFDAARAELAKAEAVKDHTPYETIAIEQTKGVLAQASGDIDGALETFRHILATERMPGAAKARMEHSVAALAFQKQDYPTSADYAARAIHDGDGDPALPLLVAESAYAAGDFKQAYAVTLGQVQALSKANKKPSQAQLQMLASSAQKQGDDAGYGAALEMLAVNYPDQNITALLFARVQAKAGTRYRLDLMRLKHQLGMLTTASDYQEAAQLALSSGFPGEADGLIVEAFAKGVFQAGDAREQRLKAYADKQLAEDKQGLEHARADATDAHDGGALVRVGFDMVTQGDAGGVALIQQGIKKGGLARPDQASLALAAAHVQLGHKADALATLRTIKGNDGSGDLAHLWTIALQAGS